MKYRPIFIASTGRAGSTLLMKILASHPEIVVRTLFPYETRAAQYYYIADREQINITNFAPIVWNNTEYRPFQGNDTQSHLWSQKQTSLDNQHPQESFEAYYSFVNKLESKNQLSASNFAEKLIGLSLIRPMLASFPQTKIVFLSRDPRDTFFSIKSFNKKRGYLSFGEEHGDFVLFNNIINFYKHCRNMQDKLEKRSYISIKYEDLIGSKTTTTYKLFESLDLEITNSRVVDIVDNAFTDSSKSLQHKTTSNAQSSIARWKQETDKEILEMFEQFENSIVEVGY